MGARVPKLSTVELDPPVVVALLRSVVLVASPATVKVKTVATAAVTVTPVTMATLVSAEFTCVPPIRMMYEPVLVGFVILLLLTWMFLVPDATVLPAHTVMVSAVALAPVSETLLLPAEHVVTSVIPVMLKSVDVTVAIPPKRLEVGSNVISTVSPAFVLDGFVYTIV